MALLAATSSNTVSSQVRKTAKERLAVLRADVGPALRFNLSPALTNKAGAVVITVTNR